MADDYTWYDDLGILSVLDGRNIAQIPRAIGDVINDVGETAGDITEDINETLGPIINPNSTLADDFDLGQRKYNFNSRTFPSDIGNGFQGHFMVININVKTGTVMNKLTGPGYNNSLDFEVLNTELSKTDVLRYRLDQKWTDVNNKPFAVAKGDGPGPDSARYTNRIAESIALYMPNSELTFSDAHDFENISLTKFTGNIADKFLQGFGNVGAIVSATGRAVGDVSKVVGAPLNPKVEILFANTFQREFAFEFLFSPSNEKEAKDLENIIRTIRFHAAPEYHPALNIQQFFWLPPSEFDITFYYVDPQGNIKENRKIPRINTCALKQVDVSYAPAGVYSTFHDGHPVQTRMVLRFIETEVNSKLRIAQGF